MKFSMTGQEKGDCLTEVTTWADLTVLVLYNYPIRIKYIFDTVLLLAVKKSYFKRVMILQPGLN